MSDLSDVDEVVLDLEQYGEWLRQRSGVSLSPAEPARQDAEAPSRQPEPTSPQLNWSRTLVTAALALVGLGATAIALTTFGSSTSTNDDPTSSPSPVGSTEQNETDGDRPTIVVADDGTDDGATDQALSDPNTTAPPTTEPPNTEPSNTVTSTTVTSGGEAEPGQSPDTSNGDARDLSPPSSVLSLPPTTELYPDNTISSTEAPDPGQPPTTQSNSPSTTWTQRPSTTSTLSALRILSPRPIDTIDPRLGFTIRVDDIPGAEYTFVGRQGGQTVFDHTGQAPSIVIPGTLNSYGGPRLEEGQLELTVTAVTAQGDVSARLIVMVRGFRPTYGP